MLIKTFGFGFVTWQHIKQLWIAQGDCLTLFHTLSSDIIHKISNILFEYSNKTTALGYIINPKITRYISIRYNGNPFVFEALYDVRSKACTIAFLPGSAPHCPSNTRMCFQVNDMLVIAFFDRIESQNKAFIQSHFGNNYAYTSCCKKMNGRHLVQVKINDATRIWVHTSTSYQESDQNALQLNLQARVIFRAHMWQGGRNVGLVFNATHILVYHPDE